MRMNALVLGLSYLINHSLPNFATVNGGDYPNPRRNSGAARIKREARKVRNRSKR